MFIKKIILISIVWVFLPFLVYAQSLNLSAPKVSYKVGDSFLVSLNINTNGQSINTVSGKILVPVDKFNIVETRSGNSILSLWVEKPQVNYSTGEISFSGGLPGGYNGSQGPILSVGLKAKKTGSAIVKLSDFTVLLNDGLGTQLQSLTLGSLNLSIKEMPPKAVPKPEEKKEEVKEEEVYQLPVDSVPPEPFVPIISRHPSISENKYFVSFSAVDKDSGIFFYEIKEKPWILSFFGEKFSTPWVKVNNPPHVLQNQLWINNVKIKAYDNAGNFTEGMATKPLHPIILWIFIISSMFTSVLLTAVIVKRKDKKIFIKTRLKKK